MKIIGNHIIRLSSVGSTNDYLLEKMYSHEKPPEGTVVVSREQTQGKGLDNNIWESSPGSNLTLSFALYPGFIPPAGQFFLNKAISLGVCEVVRSYLPYHTVTIKWPNDIYAGYGKIAGILIHNIIQNNSFEACVVGVGININQTTFSKHIPNPVSMRMLTRKIYNTDECLDKLIEITDRWYSTLRKRDTAKIDKEYLNLLLHLGKESLYRAKGEVFKGIICGVDDFGRLQVQTGETSVKVFGMKEIEFIFP